jgi:hypothetical protein
LKNLFEILVVGVLEDLSRTLELLEEKVPLFFSGIKSLYFEDLKGTWESLYQYCALFIRITQSQHEIDTNNRIGIKAVLIALFALLWYNVTFKI